MLTETIETRLLALESKCRSLRVYTITLTAICVLLCGAIGFLVGRVPTAAFPQGFHNTNGAVFLEVSQLSIKTPNGDERLRIDPSGLVVYGDKNKHEQLRLEFGGLRFFTESGESAHLDSQELILLDAATGEHLRTSAASITLLSKAGEIVWKAP